MKKACMELLVLFLALGMVMVVGVIPAGGAAALLAVGLELLFAWLIRGIYQAILREERRAIRRARQKAKAARAHRQNAGAAAPASKRAAPAAELRIA